MSLGYLAKKSFHLYSYNLLEPEVKVGIYHTFFRSITLKHLGAVTNQLQADRQFPEMSLFWELDAHMLQNTVTFGAAALSPSNQVAANLVTLK